MLTGTPKYPALKVKLPMSNNQSEISQHASSSILSSVLVILFHVMATCALDERDSVNYSVVCLLRPH